MSMNARPITIVVTAHKGGVGKSTVAQHLAEALDEHGKRTLTFAVDDQMEIAEALAGALDPGQTSWTWGSSGEVCASSWEELGEWDVSDVEYVIVDTPKKRILPAMHVDRVIVMYHDFASIKNNPAVIEKCLEGGIPYLRLAWGDNDPSLCKWAKKEGVQMLPFSTLMRVSLELCRPVWEYAGLEPIGQEMRRQADGWIRWIEDPSTRAAGDPRPGVPRPAKRSKVAAAR